jgi:hypothetical protein
LRFGDAVPFGSEDTPAHLLVKSRQGPRTDLDTTTEV